MKSRKIVTDYYTVFLPTDVYNEDSDDYYEKMCNLAIHCIETRTRLYTVPCLWTAKIVEFGTQELKFRVKRRRYDNPSNKPIKEGQEVS